jgi:hypothetical protein
MHKLLSSAGVENATDVLKANAHVREECHPELFQSVLQASLQPEQLSELALALGAKQQVQEPHINDAQWLRVARRL